MNLHLFQQKLATTREHANTFRSQRQERVPERARLYSKNSKFEIDRN